MRNGPTRSQSWAHCYSHLASPWPPPSPRLTGIASLTSPLPPSVRSQGILCQLAHGPATGDFLSDLSSLLKTLNGSLSPLVPLRTWEKAMNNPPAIPKKGKYKPSIVVDMGYFLTTHHISILLPRTALGFHSGVQTTPLSLQCFSFFSHHLTQGWTPSQSKPMRTNSSETLGKTTSLFPIVLDPRWFITEEPWSHLVRSEAGTKKKKKCQ